MNKLATWIAGVRLVALVVGCSTIPKDDERESTAFLASSPEANPTYIRTLGDVTLTIEEGGHK